MPMVGSFYLSHRLSSLHCALEKTASRHHRRLTIQYSVDLFYPSLSYAMVWRFSFNYNVLWWIVVILVTSIVTVYLETHFCYWAFREYRRCKGISYALSHETTFTGLCDVFCPSFTPTIPMCTTSNMYRTPNLLQSGQRNASPFLL